MRLEFQSQKFHPLLVRGRNRVVQLSLDAGESLERHQAPHDLMFYVVVGEVEFERAGISEHLSAGDYVVVPPSVPHSVRAMKRSIALLVLFSE